MKTIASKHGGWIPLGQTRRSEMSEFLCKNCGMSMRAKWNDSLGFIPEHYDLTSCEAPEFDEVDSEILDNDYAGYDD